MFPSGDLSVPALEGWAPGPDWRPCDLLPPDKPVDDDGDPWDEPDRALPADADNLPSAWTDLIGLPLATAVAGAVPELTAGSAGSARCVEIVDACERLSSWAQAVAALATVQLGDRLDADPTVQQARADSRNPGVPFGPIDLAAAEIGPLLHLTPRAAGARADDADTLIHTLPASWQALHDGRIDARRAWVLTSELGYLDRTLATAVETRVLPNAPQQTGPQLRRSIVRAILAIDPKAAADRHKHARKERRIEFRPDNDGMAEIRAYLTAVEAATIRAALDTATGTRAEPDPTGAGDEAVDGRSVDERRADAFVDAFRTLLADGPAPGRDPRAELQITIAASTLAGHDDNPADLTGYGPIGADTARTLAFDATWRRLITDDTGTLLDHPITTYSPSAALTRHVTARDRTCRWPGCSQPARRCDLDHRVPHRQGGPTSATNLIALCRRHHRHKHQSGWKIATPPPDDPHLITWISPTGRRYTTRPPTLTPHDP